MRKNILFSTTRQWNPGDEFILLGAINLLKEVFGDFNPIIYNRNPEVRQKYQYLNPLRKSFFSKISFRGKGIIESFFRIGFWDNSFKDDMNLDFIDMVVFAGSPEWYGSILKGLYSKLYNSNVPVLFLGIGSGDYFNYGSLKDIYKSVLERSLLITVRDEYTYNTLRNLKPVYMPCPALFASGVEKKVEKVKKIGLIYSTYNSSMSNRINNEMYKYLKELYEYLINRYNCGLICHYMDELECVYKDFPGSKVYYSYNSQDYIEIYKNFDFVIGPRVHGIGLAASLGIPGILLSHDLRGGTVKGFLGNIFSVGNEKKDIVDFIDYQSMYIRRLNNNIIEYKNIKKYEYINLLRKVI